MPINNNDRINEKLDILIEKVSKIEVKLETLQNEMKSIKVKVEEHEKEINKTKGAILVAGLLGLFGTIKTFLHLP